MDLVITLVAPAALDPAVAADIVGAVNAHRADRRDDRATDIYCAGTPAATRAVLAARLDGHAVDAVVQPVATRKKRLLVSDMDSTLIEEECIDELAAVLGLKEKVAAITERAMAGELDFAEALTARVGLLKGTPVSAIASLLKSAIHPSGGAETLMAACRAAGVRTVLVSGGFVQFAEPVAERLQMDAAFANRLLTDGSALTGRVAEPILGADAKRTRLLTECEALGIGPDAAIAVGDGANDLAMIEAAGLGLAYRAKPVVREKADGAITDLTTCGYAMGILPR